MIEKYLKELLIEKDRVAVPGLGTFTTQALGSLISDEGSILTPPSKKILFEEYAGFYNDDLLLNRMVKSEDMDHEEAKLQIEVFVKDIKDKLDVYDKSEIKGLGTLLKLDTGTVIFKQDQDFNFSAESFGLPLIELPVTAPVIDRDKELDEEETKNFTIIAFIVPLIIIIVFLAYMFFSENARNKIFSLLKSEPKKELVDNSQNNLNSLHNDSLVSSNETNESTSNLPNKTEGKENTVTKKELKEVKKEPVVTTTTKETTKSSTTENVKVSTASTSMHYLIIGSFSTVENAKKAVKIASAKGVDAEVVQRDGKIRVSIFSHQDEATVEKKRLELQSKFKDAWVL